MTKCEQGWMNSDVNITYLLSLRFGRSVGSALFWSTVTSRAAFKSTPLKLPFTPFQAPYRSGSLNATNEDHPARPPDAVKTFCPSVLLMSLISDSHAARPSKPESSTVMLVVANGRPNGKPVARLRLGSLETVHLDMGFVNLEHLVKASSICAWCIWNHVV